MPLDNTDLDHIAWVVDDLELSMKAFGSTGLQWATPTIRTVKVQTPTTAITEFSIFVTYSIHDPMHVELIQKCPGSPWDHVPNGGPHHLGWWSHDFKKSIAFFMFFSFIKISIMPPYISFTIGALSRLFNTIPIDVCLYFSKLNSYLLPK